MYESFFGLRERPFDLVPNPRYLFLSNRQREALSNLRFGVTTARGLTLLLGDAGTGKTTKLLNVVLAGQPELSVRLNNNGLRQLKQRISLRCELTRFDFPETASYIAGRLRIAGGEPARIFSRDAVLAIHEASRGVPRT